MEIKTASQNYFVTKVVSVSSRAEIMVCRLVGAGGSDRFVSTLSARFVTVNRIKDRQAIRVYAALFEKYPQLFLDCFAEDANLCVVFPYYGGVSLEEYLLGVDKSIAQRLKLAINLVSQIIVRQIPPQIAYQMLAMESLYVDQEGKLAANYFLETPVEIESVGEPEVLQRLATFLETFFEHFLNYGRPRESNWEDRPRWSKLKRIIGNERFERLKDYLEVRRRRRSRNAVPWWQFRRRKYQKLYQVFAWGMPNILDDYPGHREARWTDLISVYDDLKKLEEHYRERNYTDFSFAKFFKDTSKKALVIVRPILIGLICVALTYYLYTNYLFRPAQAPIAPPVYDHAGSLQLDAQGRILPQLDSAGESAVPVLSSEIPEPPEAVEE